MEDGRGDARTGSQKRGHALLHIGYEGRKRSERGQKIYRETELDNLSVMKKARRT